MNLKYLEYFQTLAEYEHYGRAAEELTVAQSSLSHGIDCLEKELGVYLFEKQGRNVALTRQGRLYLSYVQGALGLLADGRRQLMRCASGKISIGFVSSVRSYLLGQMQRFVAEFPQCGCMFELYEGVTDPLTGDLRGERIDLLLASEPGDGQGLTSTRLLRQKLVVIQPASRPYFTKERITVKELAEIPLILHTPGSGMRRVTDGLFEANACRPVIVGEASEDSVILPMTAMGIGAAIVTESDYLDRADIATAELSDTENYRYVYMILKKGRYLPQPVLDFIEQGLLTAEAYLEKDGDKEQGHRRITE